VEEELGGGPAAADGVAREVDDQHSDPGDPGSSSSAAQPQPAPQAAPPPPPPPPPLDSDADGSQATRRGSGGGRAKRARSAPTDATVASFGSGRILHYGANDNFMAECNMASHLRCTLTRTARPGRRKGQGRPLGLLAAWLLDPDCHEESRSSAQWARPSFDERVFSRTLLAQTENGPELLQHERAAALDEGEEPAEVH